MSAGKLLPQRNDTGIVEAWHVRPTMNRRAVELAAQLDMLLTTSAVGMAARILPFSSWSRLARNLARQPRVVASRVAV